MSPILLDAHVLLRWLMDAERRRPRSRALIGDATSRVLVSAATAREIAIKREPGKPDAPSDPEPVLRGEGFDALAIDVRHAETVGSLPALHRDTFDRMLIVRARIEKLALATADAIVRRCDVKSVDASL